MAKKKIKKKPFFKYLFLILILISLITLILLYFLNLIPFKYFLIIVGIFFFYDVFMGLLLLKNNWKKRLIGTIFTFIKLIFMILILIYILNTYDFLSAINSKNYNTEDYVVITLKDSDFTNIKELKGLSVGILKNDSVDASNYLKKKVKVEYEEYDNLDDLVYSLEHKTVSAILLNTSKKAILEEEYTEFLSIENVLYEFSVSVEVNDNIVKNVDILSTSFNVYISGVDTYGSISSTSRSDVNMIVTINPNTNQILLTSIPRDYYVTLYGVDTTYKDKLTHAGIKGIETSVKTIEDLLDIDINYYVKVNFTSLLKLVDELGGITVNLSDAFTAYYNEDGNIVNYTFKSGENTLNAEEALAFVRERKSLALGDSTRVYHQQLVLEGIINKLTSENIILKYNDILNSLKGSFITNMGTTNITKLINNQINKNPSWTYTSYTLTGENGLEYTYSYQSKKTYVMIPNEESITLASTKIKELISIS